MIARSPQVLAPPFGRVVINGVAGAGKSTLARKLSARWSLPYIDADALFWQPGWRSSAPEEFRARVIEATQGGAWIFDGNYSSVRDVVWSRAELVIWLDFPLLLCARRVLARSMRRAWSGEVLWNGNREGWRRVLSRDSVVLHTLRTHALKRQQMPGLLADFERARGGQVLVARSSAALERGLRELEARSVSA